VSDCPDPIGNLWSYVDHSHISIRRKGVGKPFTENLDDKSHPLFRLVDGDVIDLVLSEVAPKDLLSEKKVLFLRQDFYVNKEEASTLMEAFAHLNWAGLPEPDHCDWTNVRILRHGAGHPEDRVDLVAWVRSLPPKEKWTHDELERLDTKLQPGDVVVLSPLPDNGDEKTRETASKTWEKFGDVAHFIDSPR